jgi:predicted ABC-type transport system involved in lysophospholipase L1 biosynthesis ATPase subunit
MAVMGAPPWRATDGVFELMRKVMRTSGTSFPLVTHNSISRRCDRIVELVDGHVVS